MASAPSNLEFDKSLKSRLIMPFVLLLLLTTIILAALSFKVGSHALSNLSQQLLTEQAERISQVVDRHMYGSGAVLETAFPLDMRTSEDIREGIAGMQERFWTATSLYPESNNYVYYGNINGQSFGLMRHSNQRAEIRLRTRENQVRDIYSLYKINGEPEYDYSEDRVFDPRNRPWFKTVQQIQHHTWTAVYVDFSSTDLVVTRARQVISNQGEFVGVVATDLSLSALNKFVRQLKVSENARTAIVEPDGQLIAASFTPNLTLKGKEQISRVNARETDDELFNELLNKHLSNMAGIAAGTEAQLLSATTENGETMLIAYKRITDDAGLDWIAIIIQPYADVIASTVQLTLLVSIAGLIAVIAAIWIGLDRFGAIAGDIRNLAVSVSQFTQGKRLPANAMKRDDEIGMLAHSFHAMQQQLFTDRLTGVANRTALEPFLDRQIAQAKIKEESVALLFIDLNKFKPLNDTWGHNNGDLALIETAHRLESLICEQDFLARLGGDEFVIVLAAPSDRSDAQALVAQITEIMSMPLTTLQNVPAHENIYLGASVGIALYPESGLDAESILHQADQAMYENKKNTGQQR